MFDGVNVGFIFATLSRGPLQPRNYSTSAHFCFYLYTFRLELILHRYIYVSSLRLLPGIYVTAARKDYSKMATILLKCAMHCASNSSFLSSSGSSSIFLLLMPSVWCVMINSAKTDPECYFSCFSLGKRSLELETEFLGQILFPNDGLSDSII